MRLMTAAAIEQLKVQAGGPGSGRRPGGGASFGAKPVHEASHNFLTKDSEFGFKHMDNFYRPKGGRLGLARSGGGSLYSRYKDTSSKPTTVNVFKDGSHEVTPKGGPTFKGQGVADLENNTYK